MVSLQSLVSQMESMSAEISALRAQLPELIDDQLARNVSTYTWQSNLSPEQAQSQGIDNDVVVLLGKFPVTAVRGYPSALP